MKAIALPPAVVERSQLYLDVVGNCTTSAPFGRKYEVHFDNVLF